MGTSGHNEGVFVSTQSSLDILQQKWPGDCKVTASEVFESINIMEKQTEMPLGVLSRVWGVTKQCGEDLLNLLSDGCLVTRVTGRDGDHTIMLHDLIQDYCRILAERGGTMVHWHSRSINSCAGSLFDTQMPLDKRMNVDWDGRFENERYMHANLVRHLLFCGGVGETMELLSDYRWIQGALFDEVGTAFGKVLEDLDYSGRKLWKARKQVLPRKEQTLSAHAHTKKLAYLLDLWSFAPFTVDNIRIVYLFNFMEG